MTDDFSFYQGDDETLYYVIMDGGDPLDISRIDAATWAASPMNSATPVIIKHLEDMLLDVDPEDDAATVINCIFVPIAPEDTGLLEDTGQFRHELRVTLNGMQAVVYPLVGTTATFSVDPSLTWNPGTTPPAPRLARVESQEKPKNTSPSYNFAHDDRQKEEPKKWV